MKKYTFQYSVFAEDEEQAEELIKEQFTQVDEWLSYGGLLEEDLTETEQQLMDEDVL